MKRLFIAATVLINLKLSLKKARKPLQAVIKLPTALTRIRIITPEVCASLAIETLTSVTMHQIVSIQIDKLIPKVFAKTAIKPNTSKTRPRTRERLSKWSKN
jgi:polyphosphate kinase